MSKRLTDEAMSYFDECVSISTFDSSDFSAAEDLSVNSAAVTSSSTRAPTAGLNLCIDQQVNLVYFCFLMYPANYLFVCYHHYKSSNDLGNVWI